MSATEAQPEKLSFWGLLRRFPVQIPVIQRDYAQGREGNEKVIDVFLDDLRKAVTGTPIELDFIFGDTKGEVFRPLDGQQRLTTLFLLHWYAARAAGLDAADYCSILGRFSYVTRVSSRDFCRRLVNESVGVGGLCETDLLSDRIQDYAWFVKGWEFDPTVSGMLVVLDKVAGVDWPDDLWVRLTTVEPSTIQFSLVKLEKFGLSDDLYIKMNARGRALTAFENFKAEMDGRVGHEGWDNERELEARFATLVDTRWTDFFLAVLSRGGVRAKKDRRGIPLLLCTFVSLLDGQGGLAGKEYRGCRARSVERSRAVGGEGFHAALLRGTEVATGAALRETDGSTE